MLDTDRNRMRRDRTFVGSECAVCDEPLELTLHGERVLQFSCGHVSHGACFHEYLKEFESHYCPTCDAPLGLDTSCGGNAADIERLNATVRAASVTERASVVPAPSPAPTPSPRPPSRGSNPRPYEAERDYSTQGGRHSSLGYQDVPRAEKRDTSSIQDTRHMQDHRRSNSQDTSQLSSNGYAETAQSGPPRRHEYDVQSMDSSMSPRTSFTRSPAPSPNISIRSEFPTLNRSSAQQTLTCLVTVEVPDQKRRPYVDSPRIPPVPAIPQDDYACPPSPAKSVPRSHPYESPEVLEEMMESLRNRVDNWHGLDFSRFGKLKLYGKLRVARDKLHWQELECFLFSEMLICVKEKSSPLQQLTGEGKETSLLSLKGSILIKKHLQDVALASAADTVGMTQRITLANLRPHEENILTLSLSVPEIPQFHLQFDDLNQLKVWQQALMNIHAEDKPPTRSSEEEDRRRSNTSRVSSVRSSSFAGRSATTATSAPTEYTNRSMRLPSAVHVPADIVVVVPVSSSMQGVKISLVRDALNYIVQNLGDRDRLGLVTFGSAGGAVPLMGLMPKTWGGWQNIIPMLKPVGQKAHHADVVEGANVAMDLLMQRKSNNPIASIFLISDSATSDTESVDFVVSRAEAAKIAIHSFGLGMSHKPDTMIELSTRTKASYTYVKDWMMLRECVAGCLSSIQSISHHNVKLKLRLPEGSPARFVKISGALHITRRATGKDAQASLGDLRFGDKRDVLVQLVIMPDPAIPEQVPNDPWESIMSSLEALAGPFDNDSPRPMSIEEVPLLQADLTWGDILRDNIITHLPRPSLLAITMFPAPSPQRKSAYSSSPEIPPHPSIVQRRMELLTSDMLTRALTLISRGQHEGAARILVETRSILQGLGKTGHPPLPPTPRRLPSYLPSPTEGKPITPPHFSPIHDSPGPPPLGRPPPPPDGPRSWDSSILMPAGSIDAVTVAALIAELDAALEWIHHPVIFGRDARKAVLQAIGVISSQRAFTMRTQIESLWAERVGGVKRGLEACRRWRDCEGEGWLQEVMEEA